MKKTNNFHITLIVLIIINILISLYSVFVPNSSTKKALLDIEAWRVGGDENFQLLDQYYNTDAYKEQQKAALEGALQQLGDQKNQAQKANNQKTNNQNANIDKISMDDVKKIMDDAVIAGDKNARYVILEYSELLCPFCKRQHTQGTIQDVLNKEKNVNTTFRHFIVHPPAQKLAEGAECVKDQLGEEAFHKYIDKAFAGNNGLNEDSMLDLAKELGANSAKFEKCLADGKFTKKVQSQTQEGRSLFGVSGTPGNVILDTKTGRYVVIKGAYPSSEFIKKFESLTQSK